MMGRLGGCRPQFRIIFLQRVFFMVSKLTLIYLAWTGSNTAVSLDVESDSEHFKRQVSEFVVYVNT